MTTYSNPRTFCLIVVELIAERRWRIHKRNVELLGQQAACKLVLPDGTAAVGADVTSAFIKLCKLFVEKHEIPIAYDPSAINPVPKKAKPQPFEDEPVGTMHFKTFTTHNAPSGWDDMLDDLMRDLARKTPMPRKSGTPRSIFDDT